MSQQAEDLEIKTQPLGKWVIRIKSFKLGKDFVCTVDNIDPGAVIARTTAPTRQKAEETALEKARMAIGV